MSEMSDDDFVKAPPKMEFPKGWVLNFDDDSDGEYFYYNRTLRLRGKRTPVAEMKDFMREFGKKKIKIKQTSKKLHIMQIDINGDPYYRYLDIKRNQTSELTRTPPFNMHERFPYGIELILTKPFFKEVGENSKVIVTKPDQDSYLQALSKGIHCDEDSPCGEDHECDLEHKKCVPKSDRSYYDDIMRHEEDGKFFVGKSQTIQKLIESIAAKKKVAKKAAKAAKKAAEEAAAAEEERKAAEEAAAKAARKAARKADKETKKAAEEAAAAEEEAEKAAKKAAKKVDKAAKKAAEEAVAAEEALAEEQKKAKKAAEEEQKKAAKKAAEEEEKKDAKKAAEEEEKKAAKKKKKDEGEDERELNVDDLSGDYENLSALQKALMDCLVPE